MVDEVIDQELQPVVENNEPVSDRDEIANDVRAAFASLRGEEKEAEPAPEGEESAAQAAERARAPDGKFVAKEAAPEKAAPEQKSPPADDVTKASTEQPSNAAVTPPVSWAAEAKAGWSALSPAIQNAVLKREAEVSAGFRQKSEDVRRYEAALSPIAQESQRRGMTTEQGIQRLMDGQRFLETQPAQAILWLSQQHGIDLAELAQNPPASQRPAQVDPQYAQLHQAFQSLQERLDSRDMDQNMSVVQQFAQSHPFYGDVEDQLPQIMQSLKATNPSLTGQALLSEAYDLAVFRNPEVRAKITQQEQDQARQAVVAKTVEKSTQSNKAAISIKGSSQSAPAPRKPEMNGSVYDDVRNAINQVRAS